MDVAKKIIAGERLQPDDNLEFLLTTPLEELQKGAGMIQKHFFGNHRFKNIFSAITLTFAR